MREREGGCDKTRDGEQGGRGRRGGEEAGERGLFNRDVLKDTAPASQALSAVLEGSFERLEYQTATEAEASDGAVHLIA